MMLPNITKKKIAELLKDDKRLDGRKPFEYRDIEIETGISNNAEGTARVRIGKTEVIVGIKMNVQTPYPDHDDEGTMTVGMEFNPICGERYEPGPPKINAIETARVVDRGVRESGFIDWKKLCIEKGEKVWGISVDIYCINDDGNVLDACSLGVVTALKLSRFPAYDEEAGVVKFGEFTDTPLPLTETTPFAMTFHKIGDKILLDPDRDEEDAADARLTLAISTWNKQKMINSMQKGGMSTLSEEDLKVIIEQADKAYETVFPEMEKKIKALK